MTNTHTYTHRRDLKKKKKLKLNFPPKISSCLNKWLVWSLKHAVRFTAQCVPDWIGMNHITKKSGVSKSWPLGSVLEEKTQSRLWSEALDFTACEPSNHLILCHPLLLLPSIFPSIGVFSNETVLHITWPMYWSFSFSISPSNEYSGLISFRMDWLDLLAVQGTLRSLFQHHSSKASILQVQGGGPKMGSNQQL